MTDGTRSFEVDADGERLDRLLAAKSADLSRARLQQLISDGMATVDGATAKPSARLKAGQRVDVVVPSPAPSDVAPQRIPLDIVHEDRDLLVVDKPAGLAVHPAPGQPDGTLVNAVLAIRPDIEGVGGTIRPGIVHRLDKDTSGLIVVAKNGRAHAELARQFKDREVTKGYLVLVQGAVHPPEAVIEAPIGRHPTARKRMAVVTNGRPAATQYRVVERFRRHTLVEAAPETGRTHQIRVHMASVGHPVAGDRTYGRPHPGLDRQFLHANRLGFKLPTSGEYLELRSDLPEDLRKAIESLGPQLATA